MDRGSITTSSPGGDWQSNSFKTPELEIKSNRRILNFYPQWTSLRKNKGKLIETALHSPLGISTGIKKRRSRAFGVALSNQKSFEVNQSYPRASKNALLRYEINLFTPVKIDFDNMDKIRVDGSNGLRFTLRRTKGCFVPGVSSPFNASLIASASDSLMRVPKSGINPNKAVFTIDSKTSQILIVNNNACQLLGYSSKELCNKQFSDLLANKNRSHVCALAEGQLNSEDGTMVLLSGKVVEMNTKSNSKVAVSLWIRQIDHDGRCLAVAEPVERRICQIICDKNGMIVNCDYESLMIFQFESQEQLVGTELSALIPAIVLPELDNAVIPKNIRKQKATGKTSDGISFPLCLLIEHHETSGETSDSGLSNLSSNSLILITVWVFQNISGLIVIDEYGTIESCNHHFSMLMFGFAQNKILSQHITRLIPNFGQELEYLGFNRSRNVTESSLDNEESETETDPVYVEQRLTGAAFETSLNETPQTSAGTDQPSLNEGNEKPLTEIGCNVLSSTAPTAWKESVWDEEPTSGIYKSASADVLLQENAQIFKNSTGLRTKNCQAELKTSVTFSESCNVESPNQINDNDLLTPVNESNPCYLAQTTNSTSQVYNSSDIIAGLRNTNISSASKEVNVHSNAQTDYSNQVTSTPDVRKNSTALSTGLPRAISCCDGKYKGEAIHSDGNVIDILYTISSQILPCGRKVFCVWICRDPDTVYDVDDDVRHQNLTLTFNSVTSTIENSLGQAIKNTAAQNSSRPNSVSLISQCEDEQISGEFSKHYTTLKQIGKGAYGYVKMAYRNSDRLLVVAKFILKEKLCPQFMVVTEEKKEVPMEIYLLTTVKHPNIVTVYDVFENEKFFQLVMEKHGSGMDLFEFIDRRPMIDEKLGSFIFRQIANAVNYLHSLNILHRDIKDENIIIDQNFHVKLIDFGSATFMEEGKLFSTFFGTTEYCSPEVLAGNKYAGPELEMWSLGVTLYVLMFFENPFLDVEETLRANLTMPHKVSPYLENLLFCMLDKDPKTRYTMRQLMSDPWVNQDINPASFNFAWIVPCESYEANPEKYFTGQIYSSTTALSTTSPQDSLSLVDEDSIIDGEEVDDDDDDGKLSILSQEQNICDKCDKVTVQSAVSSSNEERQTTKIDTEGIQGSKCEGVVIGSSHVDTPTGKAVILKKQCNPKLQETSDSKYFFSNINECCYEIVTTNQKCCIDNCFESTSNISRGIKPENIKNNLEKTLQVSLVNDFRDDELLPELSNIKTCTQKQLVDKPKTSTPISSSYSETNILDCSLGFQNKPGSKITDMKEGNKFTVMQECNTEMVPQTLYENKTLLKIEQNSSVLSKSENNIFERKTTSKLAVYDVLSLNDLNADDPFPNGKMSQLSKMKIFDEISSCSPDLSPMVGSKENDLKKMRSVYNSCDSN